MDRFEQELARMMRDGREDTPYEDRQQRRLYAGIRARQRVRRVWTATGSVLTMVGLGVGLTVLAGVFAQGAATGPGPHPVTSAESVPMPSTARPATSAKGAPVPQRSSWSPSGPARASAGRTARPARLQPSDQ